MNLVTDVRGELIFDAWVHFIVRLARLYLRDRHELGLLDILVHEVPAESSALCSSSGELRSQRALSLHRLEVTRLEVDLAAVGDVLAYRVVVRAPKLRLVNRILAMLDGLNLLPQGGELILVEARAVADDSLRKTIMSLFQRLGKLLLEQHSSLLLL